MTEVSASRHNALVQRITRILGNGDGTFGYGQGSGYGSSPSSFEVSNDPASNTNIITAEAMNALYADMVRARVHQLGAEPQEIAEMIANANVIAESESFIVDDNGVSTVDPDGARKGILDFESLMQSIENDRFLINPNQAIVELATQNLRTSVWNSILVHEFEITFDSEDHRRHYFNSGGEIRISASLDNFITDKGDSWSQFLGSFGVVIFDHERTVSSVTGSGTAKGNYQLTNNYQTIFTSTGSGFTYTVYNGNLYTIEAKSTDYISPSNPGSKISFRITFNDNAVDGSIDDNVDGTLTSKIEYFRANSTAVRVNPPSLLNLINLD
jgi:hypothetical protein